MRDTSLMGSCGRPKGDFLGGVGHAAGGCSSCEGNAWNLLETSGCTWVVWENRVKFVVNVLVLFQTCLNRSKWWIEDM